MKSYIKYFLLAVVLVTIISCGYKMDLPTETNDTIGAGDEFYIQYGLSWTDFQAPTDVFVGADNKIYISDRGANSIVVYNQEGEKLDEYVIDEFPNYNPLSLTQSLNMKLYVVNGSNTVLVYNNGYSVFYTDSDTTSAFTSVAVDYNGKIYITDKTNNRILRISQDGSNVENFIQEGPGHGATMSPIGINISDNIYFAQTAGTFLVQKVDIYSGSSLSFNSAEVDTFHFESPYDIVFDLDAERLYVADTEQRKVFVFDSDGNYFNVVELDDIAYNPDKPALGISFTNKILYVADEADGTVKRYQFIKDADVN